MILGSAPNAVQAKDWQRGAVTDIVAINNAWRVRPDWDFLIYPDDFSVERQPTERTGKVITSSDYVPVQNEFGGFVYAGGTMAFTAGYWALGALKPDIMAFFGCDMVYASQGSTHFYGKGEPDPLREDISLRSLEAKSARLMLLAARQGCACVNLSINASRLVFPRATLEELRSYEQPNWDLDAVKEPLRKEDALGYYVPSGKYWKVENRFDTAEIDALDKQWLDALAAQ